MRHRLHAAAIAIGALLCCTAVFARDIRVAFGFTLPPYVFPSDNTGLEVDIVRSALAKRGLGFIPDYVPFARVPRQLADGLSDAASTVDETVALPGAVFSESHVTYQNVVVTLKSRQLKMASVDDLRTRNVIAFQNATHYLGKPYAKAVQANRNYKELSNQESQVILFYAHRADAIVLDINIFNFYRADLHQRSSTSGQAPDSPSAKWADANKIDFTQDVDIHPLFPVNHYKVAFRDTADRDSFNEGLTELRSSGEYDAIIARYLPGQ